MIKSRHPLKIAHNYQILFFITVIAVIGITYLLFAHADTGPIGFEAEGGAITSPATTAAVSGASGGEAVKFGSVAEATTPTQLSQPFYNPGWNQSLNAYNAAIGIAKNELWQIVATPIAQWWGVDTNQTHFVGQVTSQINTANAKKQTPIFVLYAIPGRDCGNYSAGGFPNEASYEQWVDWFTDALGTNPALVVVEPDAIGVCSNFTAEQKQERYDELTYDMKNISQRDPNAYVYLHAGSGELIAPDSKTVGVIAVLEMAGVQYGRGIAMNVSSTGIQAKEATAADQIITGLNTVWGITNMHYIVDTSRNGVDGQGSCNPRGASIGVRPTTHTSDPLADAYLWIKTPGGSDGACGQGDPSPGTFMPSLAERYAQLGIDNKTVDDLPNGTYYTGD